MGYGVPEYCDLHAIHRINIERAKMWHAGSITQWSVNDWAVAAGGEMGEVLDACKKLKRNDDALPGNREGKTRTQLVADIADEIADTFTYLDILCERLGIDFAACIATKFNRVSERANLPQRISFGS